jgi:CMP-N,N'-diacetyllegionaminic acid synthase
MNILITICGRAGSKGVKNKNIRNFLGRPLVDFTIGAASLFKEKNKDKGHDIDICINSDSTELLKIAELNDVTGIKRPEELAQDDSAKILVIKHSLNYMEEKLGKRYDFVIDLDITSPLRKVDDIEDALNKSIENKEADVVFSVVNSRRNPYFNMVEVANGQIRKIKDSNFVARQQAPRVYDMNASIYCFKRDSLIERLKDSVFDGVCDIILMKDTAVLDIDSEEDFELMSILGEYFLREEYKEIKKYLKINI